MKTSFYFFLWIIIYPLLGLLHNPWVYQNSFIVALIAVWGLSWLLNRLMPETLRYERAATSATILEEVYSGNVAAVKRRLSRNVTIDFVSAIYFGVTFVFILFSMVKGSADDWIGLLIFGFFAFVTISSAFRLNQAYSQLKRNPTPDECVNVVENLYKMDYASYYEGRLHASSLEMLPPRPRYFTAFQIVSLIIAILCGLLGIVTLIYAIIILSLQHSPEAISAGIMYFLYGSLAAYYGIKDTISSILLIKRKN